MKTQRLCGDLRDALQLRLRHVHINLELLRQIARLRDQVEQIGDRLKRIVDLMRDRRRQPPHSGQLFALHQRRLGFALLGNLK